ncbi:MAG: murein biosynthesis integral membrane protein MurJ [candidate division WOR-3 bacterium]
MSTSRQDTLDARFTRRVGSFTIGTMFSRITGVLRESVFAHLFGASAATDAFNVAFRIPNLLRDLFAESALSAAFVPTLVQSLRTDKPKDTWLFASTMLNALVLTGSLAVLLGVILSPQLVKLIAMGFRGSPWQMNLAVQLTRIMFPFLLFVMLAAWAMGVLNAGGRFFLPATAPAAFNLISAAVPVATYGMFATRGEPIQGMAWGVVAGAVAQFLIQLPALHRLGFCYRPVLNISDLRLRQVFMRWLPMLLGFGTWQVNFLINTFLLTFLQEGSVTWVNYAFRIQHLPAGLFGVAIGSVAIAEYSHVAVSPNEQLRDRFRHAMNLVSILTLPAALLLMVLAQPLTRLLYEHGRFTVLDTNATAGALTLYCLGIWSAAATRNVAAGFYSQGDTRTPAIVAMIVVGCNILLNLGTMRFLGYLCFPLNSSVTQTLNFTILYFILKHRVGNLHGRSVASLSVRTLCAALAAAGIALLASDSLTALPMGRGKPAMALALLSAGALGLAVYYVLCLLLGVSEIKRIIRDTFGASTVQD